MKYLGRLLLFAAISAVGHMALARAMARLPAQKHAGPPPVLRVQLREPPPPPPRPEPPPPEELAQQPVHEAPTPRKTRRRHARRQPRQPPKQTQVAPTERPASSSASTTVPVYGISLESTSRAGSGPVLPTGNTLQISPTKRRAAPGKVAPLAAPVPAYEVTRMPLPRGRCLGRYTAAARQAGIEGTVVLDLVVSASGRVRQVKVTKGLAHGLSEAAIRAARACRFTPGQRKGIAVPVRVRGFKVRFFLQTG